ncbi:MAG: hypothetical protein PHY31_01355 [Smithellaceae bacterium]|nr:hypothetical protein [Smithellaceae bacterium]
MRKLRLVIGVIFLCLFYGIPLYAQGPWEAPQNSEGGATQQSVEPATTDPNIINPDTFTADKPAVTTTAPTVGAGAAIDVLYSKHVKAVIVPLDYAFSPDFKGGINIPYIEKEVTTAMGQDLKASGLGDISLWTKFRLGDERDLQGVTYFSVKLPTGKSDIDPTTDLPLGTGSYDFIINQTVSTIQGPFRLKGNIGYRWNTESDYTEAGTHYETQRGTVLNYLIGADYFTPLPGLIAYLNVAGLMIERSKEKQNGVDVALADSMKTLDIIAGVRFAITSSTAVRLGAIIPAWTQFDPDTLDPKHREVLLDAGFSGQF